MEGRWEKVARKMAEHYNIKPGDKILDVGCGKGFLLYDFTKVVPDVEITGIDIPTYTTENKWHATCTDRRRHTRLGTRTDAHPRCRGISRVGYGEA